MTTTLDGQRLIALDAGSQSTRACLFDGHGRLLEIAQRSVPAPAAPQPGWSEQAPELYWAELCACLRQLREQTPPSSWSALSGVALTAQRASIVFVDDNGAPLRPAILWSDQRQTRHLALPGGLTGAAIRLAGGAQTLAYAQAQAEVNWVATHQPEIWKQTRRVLLLSSYLLFRLTGHYRDSSASQVGYLPFNFRHQRWARRGSWRYAALAGIRRKQLAELVPPAAALGAVSAVAAADCALPAGLPVVAAAADKACEVLGSGCLTRAQACLSYGTAATVNVTSDRYLEPQRFAPAYPAAVPDHYNSEVQVYRGFWLVNWFKEEFGHQERGEARALGVTAESLLDSLLESTPPGALGLMAQPFWLPGVRNPGVEARGALIGYRDIHGRAHTYRALVEGLAFALRDGLLRIEKRGRFSVNALRVAGGGARSDAIMQMTANVFDLPASRPEVSEASALGAAICAAIGLGLYAGFPSAVAGMTRSGPEFEPEPGAARLYAALFEDVYRPMYARLQPLYKALRRITGYPE